MSCCGHRLVFSEQVTRHTLRHREAVASHHLEMRERVGPRGPAGTGSETLQRTAVNADSSAIVAGMAVAVSSSGVGFVPADRRDTERRAVGIAQTSAAPGDERTATLLGVVEVDDWTPVTGAAWLPPHTRLWLAEDGLMTTSPGAGPGEYHQSLGAVVAPQEIVVLPSRVVILT